MDSVRVAKKTLIRGSRCRCNEVRVRVWAARLWNVVFSVGRVQVECVACRVFLWVKESVDDFPQIVASWIERWFNGPFAETTYWRHASVGKKTQWRTRSGEKESIGQQRTSHSNTSITANKQRVLLMSVYFHCSGHADHDVERAYRSIEKLTKSKKKSIQIVGGDFNAESGPGLVSNESMFGQHTLKEENDISLIASTKVKQVTTMESELKTSRHATKRRKR